MLIYNFFGFYYKVNIIDTALFYDSYNRLKILYTNLI